MAVYEVVHVEVEGADASRLRGFYGELFGWTFDVDESNPAKYGIARPAGVTAVGAAVSQVPERPSATWLGPARSEGYPGHATFFVRVPDVETTLARVHELGGQKLQGPDPVGPQMLMGKFADPEGHLVGIMSLG